MKLFVKVKPNSKKEGVRKMDATHFEVLVHSPPLDGKANMAVIAALARHLKVPKSNIRITAGAKSKQKIFEVLLSS